jgi:hypothetical protein
VAVQVERNGIELDVAAREGCKLQHHLQAFEKVVDEGVEALEETIHEPKQLLRNPIYDGVRSNAFSSLNTLVTSVRPIPDIQPHLMAAV